jgi:hypothetical protein
VTSNSHIARQPVEQRPPVAYAQLIYAFDDPQIPRRPAAIAGPEPVLQPAQLARVALFIAERFVVDSDVLRLIRVALSQADVSTLPVLVPKPVARLVAATATQPPERGPDKKPLETLERLAARALVAAVEHRRKLTRIIGRMAQTSLSLCTSQTDLQAADDFLRQLDEVQLLFEIAAVARTDFAGRRPQLLFRAGDRRLDVAIVAFNPGAGQARDLFKMGAGQARDLFDNGYGALSRVGPLRRRGRPNGRRWLRWTEGPLDDVLSTVVERYFAHAAEAVYLSETRTRAATVSICCSAAVLGPHHPADVAPRPPVGVC